MSKWCTVTVSVASGKRFSLDVDASSSYDAAHLYVTHVKANPQCGLPMPTLETRFEVVSDGKLYQVEGAKLAKWIEKRRQDWKGPRGQLFKQRPTLA